MSSLAKIKEDCHEHVLWVGKDVLPHGPAFGYYPTTKEITELRISGYLCDLLRIPEEQEERAQYKAVLGDGSTKFPKPEIKKQGMNFAARVLAYRCDQYFFGDEGRLFGNWPPEHVFATMKEAKKETAFTSVTLPHSVYLKALGVDKDGKRIETGKNSTEDCELQKCCANISDVRDELILCMQRKGLEKWRIDLVRELLESSHDEFLKDSDKIPNLGSILSALGILKEQTKS